MDQGYVDIQYCLEVSPFPKSRMWSDVLTKPKYGRAFLEDSLMLMNYPLEYVDDEEHKDIEKMSG